MLILRGDYSLHVSSILYFFFFYLAFWSSDSIILLLEFYFRNEAERRKLYCIYFPNCIKKQRRCSVASLREFSQPSAYSGINRELYFFCIVIWILCCGHVKVSLLQLDFESLSPLCFFFFLFLTLHFSLWHQETS